MTPTPTTEASTTSSGGGGIPEFPFQLFTVVVFTAAVAGAYLVARTKAPRQS
jgi:hypothetical protein